MVIRIACSQSDNEHVQKFTEFFDVLPLFVQIIENHSPLKAVSRALAKVAVVLKQFGTRRAGRAYHIAGVSSEAAIFEFCIFHSRVGSVRNETTICAAPQEQQGQLLLLECVRPSLNWMCLGLVGFLLLQFIAQSQSCVVKLREGC